MMLKNVATSFLVILSLLSFSCSKNDDPVSNQTGTGTGKLDVNIISTSYILNTVSSEHFDTSFVSGSYYYTITLKIKLDKPENRNQINKILIAGENGLGWEFYATELNGFYVDSIKGYAISNLIYRTGSQSYSDLFCTIKIFAKDNSTNNQYECVIKNNFLPACQVENDWLDNKRLELFVNYYSSEIPKSGKVIWKDRKYNKIGEDEFQLQRLSNQSYSSVLGAVFTNVPDSAVYYYTEFSDKFNFIERNLKTNTAQIDKRLPSNLHYFSELISFSDCLYIPDKKKVILWSSNSISVVNDNDLKVEKTLTLSNSITNIKYSKSKGACFVGTNDGSFYILDLSQMKIKYLTSLNNNSLNSFVINGSYIIASAYDYLFLLNLDTKAVSQIQNKWYTYFYDMVYNEVLQQYYCVNSNSLYSFKFDVSTETFSNASVMNSGNNFGNRIFLFPDGSKIISQNGMILECSNDADNMLSLTKLPSYFKTTGFSENGNYFVTFVSSDYYPYTTLLTVNSMSDFQSLGSLNKFYGNPKCFSISGNTIRLYSVTSNGTPIVEEYTIDEIISGDALNKRNNSSLKGYFPKKIM